MTLRVNENAEGVRCWSAAAADPGAWHRMTEAEAEYCLGVLPPIYFAGGFAVSEPIHGTPPVYLAVVYCHEVPYCRELTVARMPGEALALRSVRGILAGAR